VKPSPATTARIANAIQARAPPAVTNQAISAAHSMYASFGRNHKQIVEPLHHFP
jgi:hypothetical protein